jgi:RNA polymerase sigma-70 factor (ECF subfamily)
MGDRAAFSRLITATKGDLHRFVTRYVGDPDEALDLTQETYAAAWLSIRRYDPERPFVAWLRTIALNKCRDWSRRRRVRRMVRGVMGLDAPEAMTVGDPMIGGGSSA